MVVINIENISELLLNNKEIKNIFPKYFHIFDQWKFSQRLSELRFLAKSSALNLLNSLTDEDINLLENYFNDKVRVETLDYNIAKHYEFDINNINEQIQNIKKYGNMALYREKDQLYVSFWR